MNIKSTFKAVLNCFDRTFEFVFSFICNIAYPTKNTVHDILTNLFPVCFLEFICNLITDFRNFIRHNIYEFKKCVAKCYSYFICRLNNQIKIIYDRINNNTLEVVDVVNNGIHSIVESCLILFAMIILTITFIVGKFSLRISKPLQQLEKDVRDMSSGNLGYRTGVETDDEIGSLATTFNAMASSLQNYIVELKDVTAKEERIASELSLARHIQASMLPSEFPAFPERDEFDLFASMDPAKEVGGDFYDFFLIDESHLGLVIADVSGKGIPAALFMSVSKALIKARTMQGGTPGEILAHVNNQLLESNEAEMFVTVWLGILDLKTGKLIATNAGHEYPVIGHSDGRFELLKDKHGLVVAAMQGVRYRDYEIQLEPGDRLLVYTDGVAEATASDMTLFGIDRLLSAVNARPFTDCKTLVGDVTDAINGFVLDAPQFDDITMLCVEYKKRME